VRRIALLAAAGLAAAGLASCGDDTTTLPAETPSPTAVPSETRTNVVEEASDGKFNPADIYAKTSSGVVTIRSVFGGGGSTDLLGPGGGVGQGSGFVIGDGGEILTNAHVITEGGENGNGRLTEAKEVTVEFGDRNRVPAKVVGFDPFADVALIKVPPDGLDLNPLKLDDGKGLIVGQPVAAIGSPFGERGSLSVGVISAVDRTIRSLTRFQIDSAIQTDASINPGNSGGPLLNADAEVLGINQQIESSSGSNSGVGFAVPVTAVRRALEQLRSGGKVSYAYIGVTTRALYPQLAERLDLKSKTGALVAEVVGGAPADKAGIKAGSQEIRFQGERVKIGGDVILAVEGRRLVGDNDLARAIAAHKPGDTVTLQILRGGSVKEVKVKLGSRPISVRN
jgi:S1-C subfamily serine protease